jgi:hypothetical protein
MTRTRLLAPIAAVLIGGCGDMRLVDDLPVAVVAESYEGIVVAERAKPPISYALYEGELPAGLTLAEDGSLAGVPLGYGSYEFDVLAVDDNDRWVVATLHLDIEADDGQVYLGPVLADDELNAICLDGYADGNGDLHRLMCQPWVRIAGAGMAGQSERPLRVGAFWVGEDGEPEAGRGDDVLLRDLESLEVAWSFEPGEYPPEAIDAEPNSPVDTDVDASGLMTAGEATGPGTVHVEHSRYGTGEIEVLVVPPDFCPAPEGC